MTRIAIVSTMSGFAWGGSEYLWAAVAKQALQDDHEVLISLLDWSTNHPLVKSLQDRGAQLLVRPRIQSTSFLLRLGRKICQYITPLNKIFFRSEYQLIFNSNPDVICISQGGLYDGLFSSDLLDLLDSNSIPYVIICQHNSDSLLFDDLIRSKLQKQLDRAASVVFVSHQNLKLAERQLALNLSQAKVVQNPVNLENHDLEPFPSQDILKFASVARLETSYKGQDLLFEALSSPEWKSRNWLCCLYGSGPDQIYLESLSKHYGISEHIRFEGHVSDIRSLWAENHLLVLPSRSEGTPLSLIEAMLCGRPSVVTDVGGNGEWVEESETGFIAEASTVKSLRAALERAWLAKDDWEKMGISAHNYAIAKLDPNPGKSLLDELLAHSKK
jgi:L-malate glycosyltransferase